MSTPGHIVVVEDDAVEVDVVAPVPHVTDVSAWTCCSPCRIQVASTTTGVGTPDSPAVTAEMSMSALDVSESTNTSWTIVG